MAQCGSPHPPPGSVPACCIHLPAEKKTHEISSTFTSFHLVFVHMGMTQNHVGLMPTEHPINYCQNRNHQMDFSWFWIIFTVLQWITVWGIGNGFIPNIHHEKSISNTPYSIAIQFCPIKVSNFPLVRLAWTARPGPAGVGEGFVGGLGHTTCRPRKTNGEDKNPKCQ